MIGKSSRDIALSAVVRVESTRQYKRVFTINSTFGDIMADPKGQEIVSKMLEKMNLDDMMAMMGYMPLRGALMMGGDKIRPEMIEGLLDQLNA